MIVKKNYILAKFITKDDIRVFLNKYIKYNKDFKTDIKIILINYIENIIKETIK